MASALAGARLARQPHQLDVVENVLSKAMDMAIGSSGAIRVHSVAAFGGCRRKGVTSASRFFRISGFVLFSEPFFCAQWFQLLPPTGLEILGFFSWDLQTNI